MNEITYRPATVWDAQTIVSLWAKMATEITKGQGSTIIDPEIFFIELLVKIKKPECAVIVAVDNEKIIGFISGKVVNMEYSDKVAEHCSHLYIEEEYRGKDVLEKLVYYFKDKLKQFNPAMSEFITVYDPTLIRFWGIRGFKPVQLIFRKEA